MKFLIGKLAIVCALSMLVACGDDGGSNNGAGNNSSTNNGGNNSTPNNSSPNNSASGELTVSGDTCEGVEFSACGGELVGTWAIADGCVTPLELPYYSDCAADVEMVVSTMGGVSFADDGSFTVDESAQFFLDGEANATVPKACLDEGETCADNSIDDEGTEAGEVCELNYGHDEWIGSDGTYTTDGNALTMVENGTEFEFCVDGDTLTLKRTNAQYQETIITLQKQ